MNLPRALPREEVASVKCNRAPSPSGFFIFVLAS